MSRSLLTIIIPVYNEQATIVSLIERLNCSSCVDFEWIFVDDGSTDGTQQLLAQNVPATQKLLRQEPNQGKSAAVRLGLAAATGDWVVVQDADLEYDPAQIPGLLQIALAEAAKGQRVAVYGRRPSYWHKPSRWLLALGVLGIDLAILIVYRRWVRDHATCYKVAPRDVLESFELGSDGFEGCVEITAKLMRSGIPIKQNPISYSPRSIKQGKKLKFRDGWKALLTVWQYRKWSSRHA